MNKEQLVVAADTVASIGDHMDMPDIGGNLFTVLGDPDAGIMHVVFTENDTAALSEMISDAMCADETAYAVVAEAMMLYIEKKQAVLAPKEEPDQTDPRGASYWADSAGDRKTIFNEFDEHEQVLYWELEDILNGGDIEISSSTFRLKDLVDRSGITRTRVSKILVKAGCKLYTTPGRPTTVDAADSIIRFNS